MARLRKKVWDIDETTASLENSIDEQIERTEHELININRDLVKVETKPILFKKKRVNETECKFRKIRKKEMNLYF